METGSLQSIRQQDTVSRVNIIQKESYLCYVKIVKEYFELKHEEIYKKPSYFVPDICFNLNG